MTKIIGVSGYKRSGKDTVAKILVDGFNFIKDSFALDLKKSIHYGLEQIGFDISFDDVEGNGTLDREKEIFEPVDVYWIVMHAMNFLSIDGSEIEAIIGDKLHSMRGLLQYFGTEVVRNKVSYTFWIDRISNRIESSEINVVIPDTRFPNESSLIHDLGGKILYVDNPNVVNSDSHDSEKMISTLPRDFTVVNDFDCNVKSDSYKKARYLELKRKVTDLFMEF